MRYIAVGIVLLISSIFHTNIAGQLEMFGVSPNIFVILVTCFALVGGAFKGAASGFAAGLIQDVVVGVAVGGYTLLGMYTGLIVGAMNKRFVKDNLLVAICFVFLTTIVYQTLFYFFAIYLSGQTAVLYAFRKIILPEAVYNAAITILVFPIVLKLECWLNEYEKVTRKY